MSKKVTLKSSDGETFEIDEAVALESETIKHVIEEDFTDNDGIQLPNVRGKILAKVIQFCKKHIENPRIDEELRIWDQGFVKVDHSTLFDLILAANFLNIKNLLDVTCQTVADLIRGKTPEEVRRTFNLEIESTSEQDDDEDFWWQNQWAFE